MIRNASPSLFILPAFIACAAPFAQAEHPEKSTAPWLGPQTWVRDRSEPAIALGEEGAFDDMHIFAPTVARMKGTYWLWYCGSRGEVNERMFRLGLATSADGVHFRKSAESPVLAFADGKRSILTPTLLRALDGTPIRERGRLRMWFAATDFQDAGGRHTLHEATSEDGVRWSRPSDVLLEHVYAPSVVKDEEGYHLWYTDPSAEPWVFRYASSADGREWKAARKPVLQLSQSWEHNRLFHPTVVRVDDVFLMWYGSYWTANSKKTALGFAVSSDRTAWARSEANPVFTPETAHGWESHYTTSQSVMRLPDGTWRIWYATRPQPPFVHKYFAIGTAHMKTFPAAEVREASDAEGAHEKADADQ